MKIKTLTILLVGSVVFCHSVIATDAVGTNLNIGYSNSLSSYGSGAIGDGNQLSSTNSEGYGALLVGGANYGTDVWESLVVGEINSGENVYLSAVIGIGNYVDSAWSSLVVGENNYLRGSYAMIQGKGLIYDSLSEYNPKMIIGQYNKTIVDALFVVANGTSAAALDRKNALEITQDGKVIIPKRQGDIAMGEFGLNGD